MADERARAIFVNCPFDAEYKPLFDAVAFTVQFRGFQVRSALEISDGGETRLAKIVRLIAESGFSIHDISRIELTGGLPRFNMPIELGIAIGARAFGREPVADHRLLVLDADRYRYQRLASDLAGIDIHDHGGTVLGTITSVRDFLAPHVVDPLAGASAIASALAEFERELPVIAASARQSPTEITYVDRLRHATKFIAGFP